jgi:hypothetical protein
MNTKAVFSCIRIQLTLDLIAWYDKQANQWWNKFICTSGAFCLLALPECAELNGFILHAQQKL